jgi:hypothetical protein
VSAIDGFAVFGRKKLEEKEVSRKISQEVFLSFALSDYFARLFSFFYTLQSTKSTVLIVEKAAIIVNIILRALKIENGKLFFFLSHSAALAAETSLESRENNFVLSSFKYILP